MRTGADAAMTALARLLVGVFFRSVEVDGAEHLPGTGPTVLIANHQNGLVDGVLLMAALPRYPRWLGKSTLWRILPLRPLLALAGVIPLYRSSDADTSAEQRAAGNDAAFAEASRLLGEGVVVAIFPEGISHDEASVQALRTGAARIALAAGPGAVVVPVGLVYDDKSRFRSRALVRVGLPRRVASYVGHRDGVRSLTEALAGDLGVVAPDFADRDAARRWTGLAEVVASGGLGDRDATARRLAALAEDPGAAAELDGCWRQLVALRQALAVVGLGLGDLDGARSRARAAGFVARSSGTLLLAAPATAVGILVHVVPYTLVRVLARIPTNVGMRATVKVAGCLGLFPLTYLGLGVALARRRGWLAGVGVAVLAPMSGWVALLAGERLEAVGGAARARELIRSDGVGVAALRARRATLRARLDSLLAAAGGLSSGS